MQLESIGSWLKDRVGIDCQPKGGTKDLKHTSWCKKALDNLLQGKVQF